MMSAYADTVGGGDSNGELIRADLAANDALWRILSLVDPFRSGNEPRYFFVSSLEALRTILADKFELPPDEVDEMAKPIAKFVADLAKRLQLRNRVAVSSDARALLIELNSPVFCWYCGARFPDSVVEAFVARKQRAVGLPRYVDFVTHRGSVVRDLQIEIDHILPVASGGTSDIDNLRLSCGWCNKNKRELISIYDASSMPSLYEHPRTGTWLMPPPYWVIRTLGTRRRCEWPLGCLVRIENEQLFAAPRNRFGSLVPGNIGSFCKQHDPLARDRLVPNRSVAEQL